MQQSIAAWWFFYLSVLFLIKHYVADFLLQTGWMALGKARAENWLLPLCIHVGIHTLGTALICLAVAPRLIWLAAVDFGVHFAIDRSKAVASRAAGDDPTQAVFWWLFGLDQTLHQLTHLVFVIVIAVA